MKCLLIIAGSDPTSGAGLQSDCLTAYANGLYPMTVATAITVQNHHGVSEKYDLPSDLVLKQINSLLEDYTFAAIKIGMLGDTLNIPELVSRLTPLEIPIVWDPILSASHGIGLSTAHEGWSALASASALVTPNIPEYHQLGSYLDKAPYILLKGGHSDDKAFAIDHLYFKGKVIHTFKSVRQKAIYTHGTGCTLSTAIACQLALGYPLQTCIQKAKDYLIHSISHPIHFDNGKGAMHK